MKYFQKITILIFAVSLMFTACNKDECEDVSCSANATCVEGTCECNEGFGGTDCQDIVAVNNVWKINTDNYSQEKVQEVFILVESGQTVEFAAGTYTFENTLSIDDKEEIRIVGAGMDETIFDFTDQLAGSEGIKITADNSLIANLTVKNTVGDGIKAKDCNHFSFINLATIWEGEASESNGAYGLYPTTSTHILVDGCKAKGASDAGLYIGQCENVIVRNSIAENNVAGIEIENTVNADVYGNHAFNNTGGILVFDLPDLPSGQGSHCRVFDNLVENNSYRNFAPAGNIVGNVPPGTGIMILASSFVEVFNNTISENNMMSVGLVNYEVMEFLAGQSWDDQDYIPYPREIYVHDNTITRSNNCPADLNSIAVFLSNLYPQCDFPEVLWDGVITPDPASVCIENSGEVVDLDLENFLTFSNVAEIVTQDLICSRTALAEVVVEAPTL